MKIKRFQERDSRGRYVKGGKVFWRNAKGHPVKAPKIRRAEKGRFAPAPPRVTKRRTIKRKDGGKTFQKYYAGWLGTDYAAGKLIETWHKTGNSSLYIALKISFLNEAGKVTVTKFIGLPLMDISTFDRDDISLLILEFIEKMRNAGYGPAKGEIRILGFMIGDVRLDKSPGPPDKRNEGTETVGSLRHRNGAKKSRGR